MSESGVGKLGGDSCSVTESEVSESENCTGDNEEACQYEEADASGGASGKWCLDLVVPCFEVSVM